jgi:hypothetical protein
VLTKLRLYPCATSRTAIYNTRIWYVPNWMQLIRYNQNYQWVGSVGICIRSPTVRQASSMRKFSQAS